MAQDKKFSIITPLYKDGYKTLDNFFLHLREQDYKNFEVIVVYNSPNDQAKKAVKRMLPELKDFTIVQVDAGYDSKLKNGNHCKAFNKGAEIATGDYLLFLDPDVYLLPGVLREYKDAFDKHDVEFVYGDYDIVGAGRINGRPYNEYELKCANYISGGFPVKKSAFMGWDPKIQSLQDWDMWLSVVDWGGKGYYIGRPCFTTEAPTKSGISASGATNQWEKRYAIVRKKHGFPVSKTVVTSLGASLHATKAAQALGVDTRVLTNIFTFKPHSYENIYLLGFYPSTWQQHLALFYKNGDPRTGEIVGKNRIIHWIGTDVYQMQHKLSWTAWKNMLTVLNSDELGFIHLTESFLTQKELNDLGIRADVVPLPIEALPITPLPKKFTVGVYINPTQNMYNEEFMYEIAEAMPDIDFKFFGNADRKQVEDNKEWVGWVDMRELLPKISAMVRLTVHDGLPISPIEAQMAGRNTLTSVPLEHGLVAEYKNGEPVKADIVAKIRKLQKMPLNVKGSKYWTKETAPETYKERINELLK